MEKITVEHVSYRIESDRNGTQYISRIQPYDETHYHWAHQEALKSGTSAWKVCRAGKALYTITVRPELLNQGQTEEEYIAWRLLKADQELGLTRTGGIW